MFIFGIVRYSCDLWAIQVGHIYMLHLLLIFISFFLSQSVDNKLDYEVSSAVREVKKYLHDREVGCMFLLPCFSVYIPLYLHTNCQHLPLFCVATTVLFRTTNTFLIPLTHTITPHFTPGGGPSCSSHRPAAYQGVICSGLQGSRARPAQPLQTAVCGAQCAATARERDDAQHAAQQEEYRQYCGR